MQKIETSPDAESEVGSEYPKGPTRWAAGFAFSLFGLISALSIYAPFVWSLLKGDTMTDEQGILAGVSSFLFFLTLMPLGVVLTSIGMSIHKTRFARISQGISLLPAALMGLTIALTMLFALGQELLRLIGF